MKFWPPLVMLFAWVNLAVAAPTASENVKQKLTDALRNQLKHLLASQPQPAPAQAPDAGQIDRLVDALTKEGLTRYEKAFTLPEPVAQQLLATGPNDVDNRAAEKKNWEVYQKLSRPLPALLEYLHKQVVAGAIASGWDLELIRRISDAHSSEITDALKREADSPKDRP